MNNFSIGKFILSIPAMIIVGIITFFISSLIIGIVSNYIVKFITEIIMFFVPNLYIFSNIEYSVKDFLEGIFTEIDAFVLFVLIHYFTLSFGENFIGLENKHSKIITIVAYILSFISFGFAYRFLGFADEYIKSGISYTDYFSNFLISILFVGGSFILAVLMFISKKEKN